MMRRVLSEVRSRFNFIKKTSNLTRSIATAPFRSIPDYEYRSPDYYPDRIADVYNRSIEYRNGGYLDLPYWSDYGEAYRYGICPSCREACFWGSDGYAPYWVNAEARWSLQPRMTVDYHGNMVCGRPYYGEDFHPDYFYPYRHNVGHFYDGGGREFQGSEQPWSTNWTSGKYPQTWDRGMYDREHYGGRMPCETEHGSNYGLHWKDTAARENQESQDIHGLRGYDQLARSQSTVDYNHNTVAEIGRLERSDVSSHGHEYINGFHAKKALGQSQQNVNSIPYESGRVLQVNGPHQLNVAREGDEKSWDGYEWRNESNQPQSYTSEYPNMLYTENQTVFPKNLTEHSSSLYRTPEAGGQHYAQYNDFRNGKLLDRPEVHSNRTVNLDYKENWNGSRQRDVKGQPQSFTVNKHPAKMADKIGKPHQSLKAYLQVSNETATHCQQQPQAKRSHYPQKTDRNQCQAHQQSSDWDFVGDIESVSSPTLNAAHSGNGPEVINSGSSAENLETEQIRGIVEELETFIKDGKLMLAVKVLDVMEKKKNSLDPERDMPKIKMLIWACGNSNAVTEAKAVHNHIVNLMSPLKFSIYNKILGMYLKCGAVSDACSMFYSMAAHNLTSWDTMIKGLVKNNFGEEALDVFAEFKNTDSEPDGSMFLGVFSACRLVGDVVEGMLHFESMTKQYGIVPSMKHYISIVDMMGHLGHLDEALEFIEKMPVKPSTDVWETMMNVCRIHGNTELGDRCAEVVLKLDPTRLSGESKAGFIPLIVSNHGKGEKL